MPHTLRALPALVIIAAAAPAAAQTDAITATYTGNHGFAGTLSQEFTVTGGPIGVTRFGAFDDDGLGFAAPITVRLYDATTGLQVGESVTFSGLAGTAQGSFRFLDLAAPFDLPTGFVGRIGASGYDGAERYYNAFFNGNRLVSLHGGGRLAFGRVYYDLDADGSGFPEQPSGNDQGGWYGTASFTFGASVTATPEPATWATLGGGLLALGVLRARRRPDRRPDRREDGRRG